MPGLSRRSFLSRSSVAMAVGSAATIPGLGSVIQSTSAEAPELDGAATEAEAAAADSGAPLIAHITDLRTGEISFYEGEREVVLKNPGLATRLYRISR